MFPGEVTVDQSNQDVYALEVGFGEGKLYRFHADGTPHNFTAGPGAGTNRFEVSFTELGSSNQMAVDNSPGSVGGPLENALYMPLSSGVRVFAQSGEPLGLLNGSGTNPGASAGPAASRSTRARASSTWRTTTATSGSTRRTRRPGAIDDSDYTVKGITTTGITACAIAADTLGQRVRRADRRNSSGTPGKSVPLVRRQLRGRQPAKRRRDRSRLQWARRSRPTPTTTTSTSTQAKKSRSSTRAEPWWRAKSA